MKKDKHITIALETETHRKLVALAAEDKRPISNLVRYITKLYIRGVEDGSIRLSIYSNASK